MTLAQILAPVALATVVNVFLFALFWRGHRAEARTGSPPGWMYAGVIAYALPLTAFAYFGRERSLSQPYEILAAAFIGEAFGAMLVYTLLAAFLWSRGQPLRDRAFNIGLSVMLLGGLVAVLVQ